MSRKFNIGDRVVVTKPPKFKPKALGKHGVLVYYFSPYYYVLFDGEKHDTTWLARELEKEVSNGNTVSRVD